MKRYAFAYRLVLAPRRVWRAFVRGRHSRTLIAPEGPPTWTDRLAFAGWITLVAAPVLGFGAPAIAILR